MRTRARRGRFVIYDKQKVLEAIVAGKLSAQQIAVQHDITRDMVYSLKHAAKKRHIIKDPAQRLDDLLPVEPVSSDPVNNIYQLACRWRDASIDNIEFYQALKKLVHA